MTDQRSRVTTHVLDATSGRPAANVDVTLEQHVGQSWQLVTSGRTDADGRFSVRARRLKRGANRIVLRGTSPGLRPWTVDVSITRR